MNSIQFVLVQSSVSDSFGDTRTHTHTNHTLTHRHNSYDENIRTNKKKQKKNEPPIDGDRETI